MRLTTIESERFGLALAVSLAIHLLLLIGSLLIPDMRSAPERPESPPIQVRFEPLSRPDPEPSVPPAPVPVARSEPVPARTSSQPQAAPVAQPEKQSSPSSAAGQSEPEEFPEWTPPAQSVQNIFGKPAQSTVEGGRLSQSPQADTQAQVNDTSRDLGSLDETPVTVKSSGSSGAGGGFTDADLSQLDRALSNAQNESAGGGSAAGGRITDTVAVGSIDNLGEELDYRGASYTGLPQLSSEAQVELASTGLPDITVEVNFMISPQGRIEALKTSAASRYPFLDEFLIRQLPRVLSFEALPDDDRYAEFYQQVSLELRVESN